ncbi:putative capsular polysaccharide synthesis family protein [Dactylosporangium sp. NPDC050688]|uniref:putative capsular polysaccharide synthesis family protein n=1 Tax=Dactylosporangium sp. NPDC050688 TaxID=3157217 RepID=UPI0033FA4483
MSQASGVVVYQMGKVGSSTVHRTLREARLPVPVYKTHYLSDEGVARARRLYANLRTSVPLPHEQTVDRLRETLRTVGVPPWKVITLVREPVARDVSAYLQMVDVLHPQIVGDDRTPRRAARAATAQFLSFDEHRNYTCTWFDVELKAALGVDVFAQPFDHTAGCVRLRRGDLEVLVLRTEDLDSHGAETISDFLGVRVPLRHASSRAPDKLQSVYTEDIYRQVVSRVRLPEPVCRRIYSSRYARHFYLDEERERFIAKWSGPRP